MHLTSRHHRNPAPRSVQLHDLAGRPGAPRLVTPINQPDVLAPLDHPIPFLPPVQADVRLAITQKIAELAAAGSVDSGSGAVLDHWIDSLLDEWYASIDAQARDRSNVAAILVAADDENITREMRVLAFLQDEMERAHANRVKLLGEVGLPVAEGDTPTVPRMPELPPPAAIPQPH